MVFERVKLCQRRIDNLLYPFFLCGTPAEQVIKLFQSNLRCVPVVVRNYTDDEATIIMVDSNIQREDILPSEKAREAPQSFHIP